MKTIIPVISFIFFIGLVVSPVLLVRKLNRINVKYKFRPYFIIGIIITAVITLALAWWSDASDRMLLAHYGYNIDGTNETEFYGQVSPENIGQVKSLETNIWE